MKKILVVVDMQKDFVSGSLGSNEAKAIVSNVVNKIKEYRENKDVIIATFDTHNDNYLSTQEGCKLPVKHCIEGTDGWELDKQVAEALDGYKKHHDIKKDSFGTLKLVKKIKKLLADANENVNDYQIELTGLCYDICVISNAIVLKSAFPETKIVVDLSCTAATSKEAYEATKLVMKSCQIDMVGE